MHIVGYFSSTFLNRLCTVTLANPTFFVRFLSWEEKNIFEFCYVMMAAAGQNKITLDQWRIKQHSRLSSVWAER